MRQLFSKEEVFCGQRAAGLGGCQNEPAEIEQDRSCRPNTMLQGGKEDTGRHEGSGSHVTEC
jgi:hypothetical protein